MTDTQTDNSQDQSKKPHWTVKTPKGYGRDQRFITVGAAWNRDDGGICIRLTGTQIIENDLYIYEIDEAPTEESA